MKKIKKNEKFDNRLRENLPVFVSLISTILFVLLIFVLVRNGS